MEALVTFIFPLSHTVYLVSLFEYNNNIQAEKTEKRAVSQCIGYKLAQKALEATSANIAWLFIVCVQCNCGYSKFLYLRMPLVVVNQKYRVMNGKIPFIV